MQQTTVQATITGRVQGVSFRAWTQDQARARGIAGWVRNEADGSVTALLHGDAGAVAEMLSALGVGPRAAHVTGVETAPADPPEGRGFAITG